MTKRDSGIRRKPVGSGSDSAESPTESPTGLAGTMEQRFEKGQAQPHSLDGVVDLTNTEDNDYQERYAPAVTHETINREVHHIREEKIHREIHNHTYLHRIQPVLDFEVLPARHYIPSADGESLVEVAADQLPECTGENQKWFIAEKRATTLVNGKHPNGLRPLVGLDLDGYDEKRSVGPGGFERIETTWVYPPALEDISKVKGPTYPVHFGECSEECAVPRHSNMQEKPDNHTSIPTKAV